MTNGSALFFILKIIFLRPKIFSLRIMFGVMQTLMIDIVRVL